MRLEHLCDVDMTYDLYREVTPEGGADGLVYGQGRATFSGRLAGTATWSNFPRLRRGFAHPHAHGALDAEGGGTVLYTVTGLSDLADGSGIHGMTFSTDHEPLLWLNDVFAVGEGSIDPRRHVLSMRYYSCHVDHPPDLPNLGAG